MNTNRTYTIRQLTKEFGVTARTLRFYEDEGLIAPERRGQTRIYSSRDRARIILILRGRRVGFSLAEIREILDLYDVHDGGVTQIAHARKKFEERIAHARAPEDRHRGVARRNCTAPSPRIDEAIAKRRSTRMP